MICDDCEHGRKTMIKSSASLLVDVHSTRKKGDYIALAIKGGHETFPPIFGAVIAGNIMNGLDMIWWMVVVLIAGIAFWLNPARNLTGKASKSKVFDL